MEERSRRVSPESWQKLETTRVIYRPISLLPVLGKLLEKILLRRLERIVEDKKLLPNEQFGFRKGHDTVSQAIRLVEKIADGFSTAKDTAAVFLDVSRAFDSGWSAGLILKLKGILPHTYIAIIWSYLSNRTFRCRVNGAPSSKRPQRAGTLQGGLLSPLLYALATRDFPKMNGAMLNTYADDAAISVTSNNYGCIQTKLQMYLDELGEWARKWRFKFNAAKTCAVYFLHIIDMMISMLGHRVLYSRRMETLKKSSLLKLSTHFVLLLSLKLTIENKFKTTLPYLTFELSTPGASTF